MIIIIVVNQIADDSTSVVFYCLHNELFIAYLVYVQLSICSCQRIGYISSCLSQFTNFLIVILLFLPLLLLTYQHVYRIPELLTAVYQFADVSESDINSCLAQFADLFIYILLVVYIPDH